MANIGMIISHRHKFIFIKTRKTAGTSVEIALSRFCGPEDIITPIAAADEEIRHAQGGRGPQNFHLPRRAILRGMPQRPLSMRDDVRALKSGVGFFNHMGAALIRKRIPANIWNGYYKFCFERNPWDKTLSDFFWKKRAYFPDWTLDDYFAHGVFPQDSGLYCSGNLPVVDRVCRYETLEDNLREVCAHLDIPFDGELPRAKGSIRPQDDSRAALGDCQREIIEKMFHREIDLFGYGFAGQKAAA
jgi:hypothetical protein